MLSRMCARSSLRVWSWRARVAMRSVVERGAVRLGTKNVARVCYGYGLERVSRGGSTKGSLSFRWPTELSTNGENMNRLDLGAHSGAHFILLVQVLYFFGTVLS